MQIQTCIRLGFTMPEISRFQRWALTPPLHNRLVLRLLLWVFRQCSLAMASSLPQLSYVAHLKLRLMHLLKQAHKGFTKHPTFLWHCPHAHAHLAFPSNPPFWMSGLSSQSSKTLRDYLPAFHKILYTKFNF